MKSTKEEVKNMGAGSTCAGCGCNCHCGNGCSCQCLHQRPYGSAPITRWILGLIVVVMIFSLGLQVGEMKGWLEHDNDYPGRQWGMSHALMMSPVLDARYTVTAVQPLSTSSRPR
jgi:hypothetical protein